MANNYNGRNGNGYQPLPLKDKTLDLENERPLNYKKCDSLISVPPYLSKQHRPPPPPPPRIIKYDSGILPIISILILFSLGIFIGIYMGVRLSNGI